MLDNVFDGKSASKSAENGNGQRLPIKGTYGPPETENVNIYRLLEELEDLPEKAKHIRFLRTMIGFDEEQFFYLVMKIRANLPEEMKKAQRVARDSEQIVDQARDVAVQQVESGRAEANQVLEEARNEGQRIIEQARQHAAAMMEKSEVHQMATAQAREMLRRAEVEAAEIRKGADDYARDVLSTIEGHMSKAIVTVQRGRELLEHSRG